MWWLGLLVVRGHINYSRLFYTNVGLKKLILMYLGVCTGIYFISGIRSVICSDTKYLCVMYLHAVSFTYILYILTVIVKSVQISSRIQTLTNRQYFWQAIPAREDGNSYKTCVFIQIHFSFCFVSLIISITIN